MTVTCYKPSGASRHPVQTTSDSRSGGYLAATLLGLPNDVEQATPRARTAGHDMSSGSGSPRARAVAARAAPVRAAQGFFT